ncbi:MAG: fumarylacetoacetate hydrolase [Burkholderiaceae bacterium]|nr:fumarylacetoacetate hydrolase [Burkholderiaceae bacterium]
MGAALLTLAVLAAPVAEAACLGDQQVADVFAAYQARKPAANPEGLSAADGECTRAKFNALLGKQMGKPVGYKAGLTNPAVQKRFGADAPVWGTLYAPMLLKDGAKVDAAFGARPLYEADLLVRVSDTDINRATTPEQVLVAIDQVIPFIELPDLVVEAPPKLNGAAITAINVGARLGVLGAPIPVQYTTEFSRRLRDMEVIVKADGQEVDRGMGSDVLGHPLNAVVWLVKDMARSGQSLKVGDLVSLGSFSKLMPPKPGLQVEVIYNQLPGTPIVSVDFK